MIRQTEWMSGLLSKIAASEAVDFETEEKLDELRRTVGLVQHHFVFVVVYLCICVQGQI